MNPILLEKIKPLILDSKRLKFLIELVRQQEWVTLQEFEKGYRLYTPSVATRICDSIEETIDSAMGDDYFHG